MGHSGLRWGTVGALRGTLVHSGALRGNSGYSGAPRGTLGHSGGTLGHSGGTLGHAEAFWEHAGAFWKSILWVGKGALWGTLGHSRALWHTLLRPRVEKSTELQRACHQDVDPNKYRALFGGAAAVAERPRTNTGQSTPRAPSSERRAPPDVIRSETPTCPPTNLWGRPTQPKLTPNEMSDPPQRNFGGPPTKSSAKKRCPRQNPIRIPKRNFQSLKRIAPRNPKRFFCYP